MTSTDWSIVWSIVSGIVSLALGVLAIWLSVHFYTKGKDTEQSVSNSLAEIKAQTAALERISAKQLMRLTKFATEARPSEHSLGEVARTFREMSMLVMRPAPTPASAPVDRLQADLLTSQVHAMYFAGLLNVFLTAGLSETEPGDEAYGWICGAIEQSFVFFRGMEHVIARLNPAFVQKVVPPALLREIRSDLSPIVKNVLMAQMQMDAEEADEEGEVG